MLRMMAREVVIPIKDARKSPTVQTCQSQHQCRDLHRQHEIKIPAPL
ncbi:MAG: hypothetical protein QM498_11490 [Desulfobacterium sp.]